MIANPSRPIIAMALLLAAIPTLATARRLWSGFPGTILTPNHATILGDYLVMWVSGQLALAHHLSALATYQAFNDQVAALLGCGIDGYYWLYPPHLLLIAAPLALLPPFASLAAWTALTLAFLWTALRLVRLPVPARVAVLLSPACLENMLDGQNGALLAAAMIGALGLQSRLPWLAGLFASLLTLKPQLAILVPFCLLAAGSVRALVSACVCSAAWIALSLACFGLSPWLDYVDSILPQARALHLGLDSVPFGTLYLQNLVVTPFAAIRSLGGTPALAQPLQAAITLFIATLAWRLYARLRPARSPSDPRLPLAFALAALPLATPYAMTYDMIGPAVACTLLLATRPLSVPLTPFAALTAALAWTWPGLSIYAGLALGLPGLGAPVFALLAAALWHQTQQPALTSRLPPPFPPPPFPPATARASPET